MAAISAEPRWKCISCVVITFRRTMLLLAACLCFHATAQTAADSDGDGLSDALEQKLLEQFQPVFFIGTHDCSEIPAEFQRDNPRPVTMENNGTVYGQVFPTKDRSGAPAVEVHYYHLWRTDCGRHGHPLDAEHVSVLLHAAGSDPEAADWTAKYWYAAAHEDTVCDVSQIARSSTLHAEHHGATVWISPDKHASYLSATSCSAGCGADRCTQMKELKVSEVINLGEEKHPMNGSAFVASNAWPLAGKMRSSNFPATALARLDGLPSDDIVWYNTGRHPAQGIIAISSHTQEHIANAGAATGGALGTANENTAVGLGTAQDNTGSALGKSYRNVKHALGTSAKHVGEALRVTDKDDKKPQTEQ